MESMYCLMLALLVALVFSSDQDKLFAYAQANEFLVPHNAARGAVGVAPLTWDTTLESYARTYAQSQATSCSFVHSQGPYGENIYWQTPSGTPADAVVSWVAEKQYYDYAANYCSDVCGHYTQVVWRDTTKLGCASATCTTGGTYIVCSYDPPGNVGDLKPY